MLPSSRPPELRGGTRYGCQLIVNRASLEDIPAPTWSHSGQSLDPTEVATMAKKTPRFSGLWKSAIGGKHCLVDDDDPFDAMLYPLSPGAAAQLAAPGP